MPSLKEVKNRINSVISTQQITKAMKMVAAAKLRRSQDRITQMRPFALKLGAIIQNLSAVQTSSDQDAWYSQERPVNRVLIIAITSDRGLCGSFNSNVFKGVARVIEEKYAALHQAGKVTVLTIGRKSEDFFTKRKYQTQTGFTQFFSRLSYEAAAEIGDYVMDEFKKGTFDKVEIVFNEFKNVATQVLRTEQVLPIIPQANQQGTSGDYIFQPDQEAILQGVIPKAIRVHIFKALLDSNAAENGARMTAMDKATENAGELLKELKLTYNRTRQAAITKEILEIVGGAEALKAS